jgi:multiple sugar transport system substrate-binding protein
MRHKQLATLAAVGLSATAWGATPVASAAAPSAVESRGPITIWLSNNTAELEWGNAMVDAWNAEHPDEQIESQEIPAGRTSEEVIGAAITAGNAPCLVFNTAPAAVPQFQRQGGLVSLDSFEDGADYVAARTGDRAEQYRSSDGGLYQMPWKANPVMIIYNRAVFEEAGLDPDDPPLATYDEFLETSQILVDSGGVQAAIWPSPAGEFFQPWFDFYPLYIAQTGLMLVEDGQATFASEDGFAVANFWRSLYDAGLTPREAYPADAFADGESAMSIVGPWAIAVYGDDIDWGVVPVPTAEGTPAEEIATFSDEKSIGMFTACENQATAWDVLKFATSEEQDGALLEATGQMPMRTDLLGTFADYFEANPDYAVFAEQAERTVEVPNVENSIEVWQTFRDAWSDSVIFGEGDPEDALTTAAEAIDDLVSG